MLATSETACAPSDRFPALGTRPTSKASRCQTNIACSIRSQPTDPSRPKILLNMLVSIFLGTCSAWASRSCSNWGNRRVRSAEDIVEAIDLPVLAIGSTLPPPTLGETLKSLLPFRRKPAAA